MFSTATATAEKIPHGDLRTIPRIIGFTGNKQNGKSTVTQYIVEKYDAVELSFAGPLKDGCRELFGFNDEQLYGNLKEVVDPFWNVTPREILQFVGTDLIRKQMSKIIPDIGESFWIKCLENKVKKELAKNPNVTIIISDIRFPNEMESVKKMGGLVIRVTRPEFNNKNNEFSMHESEKLIATMQVDAELWNDATKEKLFENLENILCIV
jgi:hypothetical protein